MALERGSGMAGLENRPAAGRLCPLDHGMRRGSGIMGCNYFFNSGRVIHNLSSISPLKSLVFPKVYPQKSKLFLQKSAVFPGFSTFFGQLSTTGGRAN